MDSEIAGNPLPAAATDLLATVVASGCCVGCGTCAAFEPRIKIELNHFGQYVAACDAGDQALSPIAARVCPFADGNPDENDIARELFGNAIPFDPHIGCYLATYAGWVTESDFREKGSSGGLASWLLVELLNRGYIDQVIHVGPVPSPLPGDPLFRFTISSSPAEVRANAKSRYYPVEMSKVITHMLHRQGRYAVVGVPCFIKALHLACRQAPTLKERMIFTIGIVCGHLKSTAFAEMFAWQCGIAPSELRGIDFRTKLTGRPASEYAVSVVGERTGHRIASTKSTSELFGSNWGYGFFKYKACDFCDDVVAETADISIGDAWLPEYEVVSAGTNIVIVRDRTLESLLSGAAAKGRLNLDHLPVERIVTSQDAGLRHRREGLAYRCYLEDKAGGWHPRKRVAACARHLSALQRRIFECRRDIAAESHAIFHTAKRNGNFQEFLDRMKPLLAIYGSLYLPLWKRTLWKIRNHFRFEVRR